MNEPKCAAVLLGPPGSGKTTLARTLAGRNGISVIETGNLLEQEIRHGTPLGLQIKPYKIEGALVPSELVRQVITGELERVQAELVLFDGFPRSVAQIEIFFQLLKEHQLSLCAVIVLSIDSQTVIRRLSGRRMCPNCGAIYNVYMSPPKQDGICDRCGGRLIQREDDRAEVARERLKGYERETLPVVEFFRRKFGRLTWEEPATQPPDQLLNHVWRRLGEVCCGMPRP